MENTNWWLRYLMKLQHEAVVCVSPSPFQTPADQTQGRPYVRKVMFKRNSVTWWNWNPRLLLGESCGGALLFHNHHFRPHPYDRSNRIDTARRCHCCHILMLIQNFWEIASNHQCIILSPSFCWGDIHSRKYISLTPPFDSYHLLYEAPWSSQVILHPPLP